MEPQREIRYYASVPKLLLLVLFFCGLTVFGWWVWTGWHIFGGVIVGALLIGSGGLGALAGLGLLVDAIVLRNPMLLVDDSGFTTSLPLRPSRHLIYPWADISGIGVTVQELGGERSFTVRLYYLAVYRRDPDSEAELDSRERLVHYIRNLRPSFRAAPPIATLDFLFLWPTRRMRANMLERIKTTFTPEISRYHIRVDEEERPL